MRPKRLAAAAAALALATLSPTLARAAPRWVYRQQTIERHVFAGDVGLGLGHVSRPGAQPDDTGFGLNLEGGFGITRNVDVGLRTGVRFGDEGKVTQADEYGRTLWTETVWGTRGDTVANPEARVRWTFYSGDVVEIGLDGRGFLPIEDGSRIGFMVGVPFTFHLGSIARIDLGLYTPVVFYDRTLYALTVPTYFWFQASEKVWLGPMTSTRFVRDQDPDLLLGFGLGVQVARAVDLKTMILFPSILDDAGARNFGAGFGVQFRIGE